MLLFYCAIVLNATVTVCAYQCHVPPTPGQAVGRGLSYDVVPRVREFATNAVGGCPQKWKIFLMA